MDAKDLQIKPSAEIPPDQFHQTHGHHFHQSITSFSTAKHFNPADFFIPGWKGEGLITSHALEIKKVLGSLLIDAQSLFKKYCYSTRSMRIQTFQEFSQYANYYKIDISFLVEINDFWMHAQDPTSPLKEYIEEFCKLHCFRAVSVYLFRIKFIVDLSVEQNINIDENVLTNPLTFLSKIFVKNSSTELNCESLQINNYSWYRPGQEYRNSLIKIKHALKAITLTELIKLISTPQVDKIYSVKNYSHSLSHLSFGLFVNELLVKFPNWLNSSGSTAKVKNTPPKKPFVLPKTINTRFHGNHVSSIALAHWLAQETNVKNTEWDHIIAPEFEGQDFIDGQFLKVCQELQLLSFLVKVSYVNKYDVIPFICKVMREKYQTVPEDNFGQTSFFNLSSLETHNDVLFNRIVLNITDLPKTNPHHFLIQQILNQKCCMKKDSMLFAFSNQKLFVPSHSDRVELLLKDFKIEAFFNLENLKGKGEIANYLYILTKRVSENLSTKNHLIEINRKSKESCLSFEFRGNLTRFNIFQQIVDEMCTFMKAKGPHTTPIYSNELCPDLIFEFHHDAVIDGKLVSSAINRDQKETTHPNFFKNLTKSSLPLDSFFQIEVISNHETFSQPTTKKQLPVELLGVSIDPTLQYPLLLIVNQNDQNNVKIEITPIETYKSKLEQYGTAFYYYFGLTPKHLAINLNVFREYFSSLVGHQIIQMHLSDGPAKLKAKLKSLLVPSFFASTQFLPDRVKTQFSILDYDASTIKSIHPEMIKEQFQTMTQAYQQYVNEYPWHILGLLSHFKLQIQYLLEELSEGKNQRYNFNNGLISNKLIKLKTYPIYPKNDDVFVEFKIKGHLDLKLPLTSIQLQSDDNNKESCTLILKNNEECILNLHSSPIMGHFIKFILQNAIGVKISDILLNLKIPMFHELEETCKYFEQIKNCNESLLTKTEHLITSALKTELLNH